MSSLRLRRVVAARVPIARLAVAATAAYVIATRLVASPAPVLAPLTALLVVSSTVSATLRNSLQRIVSVIAGVLVALAVTAVVPLTWWSLGVVVLGALLVGRHLHLGDQYLEVPISAMLILAVSWQADVAAWSRVDETLLGAVVGVLVSLLAPSLHLQPAGDALGELGVRTAAHLRDVGRRVTREWTVEDADGWVTAARGLSGTVDQARKAVERGEESLKLNPRRRSVDGAERSLAAGLTSLESIAIHVRVICRSLRERVAEADAPTVPIRWALGHLLRASADAVDAFAALVAADVTAPVPDVQPLREAVARARTHATVAAELLLVDGAAERETWHAHGALLAHCDRLLDELDPDLGGAEALGRPAPRLRRRLGVVAKPLTLTRLAALAPTRTGPE